MADRSNYEQSYRKLMGLTKSAPIELPSIPVGVPRHDAPVLGVSFFKERVEGDMSNLTLPRSFFGRSEILATFRNSDLHESNMCWNDFFGVDFSDSELTGSDMRSSIFDHVNFAGANLSSCDLRRSTFVDCNFLGATMKGTILTRALAELLGLSARQRAELAILENDGAEPEGG